MITDALCYFGGGVIFGLGLVLMCIGRHKVSCILGGATLVCSGVVINKLPMHLVDFTKMDTGEFVLMCMSELIGLVGCGIAAAISLIIYHRRRESQESPAQ